MASGKKRRTHNEAYMYDNLVRVRRPQIHQEAGYYEEEARTVSPQTKNEPAQAMKLGFGYVTFFRRGGGGRTICLLSLSWSPGGFGTEDKKNLKVCGQRSPA